MKNQRKFNKQQTSRKSNMCFVSGERHNLALYTAYTVKSAQNSIYTIKNTQTEILLYVQPKDHTVSLRKIKQHNRSATM